MRILVWGLGYVGTVSAACFARLGHEVVGIDPNLTKVEAINRGDCAIKEPGLPELSKQAVNAGTTIVEIVDPAVVELDGIVDEIDVLFIRNGASATISMDALPGQTIRGSVSAVASAAQRQQGVVSYPIRIRIAAPDSVQLPEGLSAVASVVIREDNDVLLVPLQSLRGSFDQPAVQVMFNGRLEERAVTLGNSDDFWVVIESGLSEGDMVVVESQSASTTGAFGFGGGQFRRFSGQFGGGVPGGGFRGGGGNRGQGNRN